MANCLKDLSCFCLCARQAWQKLGAMPPEEAMQKYIDIVTELYPSWAAGSATVRSESFSLFQLSPSFILIALILTIVVGIHMHHIAEEKR